MLSYLIPFNAINPLMTLSEKQKCIMLFYAFGLFGKQTLDNAIDNDDGTDVQWSWFKTEEERDKIFLEREKNNG